MEAMIKRIIDIDEKAREITDAAQRERKDSEEEIVEKARRQRDDYLEKARARIRTNLETEQKLADEEWKQRQAYYADQAARLEKLAADNRSRWIEEIVARVTG